MIEPFARDVIVFVSFMVMVTVGITLTYMTSKVPNFAQGTFVTVGMYVSLTAAELWGITPYASSILSFTLGGLVSYLMYKFAIAPQIRRNASVTALIMTTVAIDTLFVGILNAYADYLQYDLRIISRVFLLRSFDFLMLDENGIVIVAPALVISLAVILHMILTRTAFGTAMRAAVVTPSLASVLGVNIQLVYSISWFVAGALAGLAGGLFPLWFQGSPDIAFSSMIISAFAGSILGGLMSIYGALLGGAIMGLADILGSAMLSDLFGTWMLAYRIAVPLAVMIVILLLLPNGITGTNWRELLHGFKAKRS